MTVVQPDVVAFYALYAAQTWVTSLKSLREAAEE
jgi:hypothetical protein